MLEFLGVLLVIWVFGWIFTRSKSSSGYNGPTVMRSDDIEGHYDFLEMHGFMTPEEREEQRRLERELKEHPERFKTVSIKEFFEEKK